VYRDEALWSDVVKGLTMTSWPFCAGLLICKEGSAICSQNSCSRDSTESLDQLFVIDCRIMTVVRSAFLLTSSGSLTSVSLVKGECWAALTIIWQQESASRAEPALKGSVCFENYWPPLIISADLPIASLETSSSTLRFVMESVLLCSIAQMLT
jgi:hypothetical protein